MKSCSDIGFFDIKIFERSFAFYSSVAEFLLILMQGQVDQNGKMNTDCLGASMTMPLNHKEVPKEFAALPEWIIDDMADFFIFALQ